MSYQKHSSTIKEETIDAVIKFLVKGAESLNPQKISLILHGGEPLLVRKKIFDYLCSRFYEELNFVSELQISVQTNALLIDEEWISLFEKHSISVGVSIDGTKEYHDKYRIDHKSKGSYDIAIKKVQILQDAARKRRIFDIGCLSVINKDHDAHKIYNHLVHVLGFTRIDLLLPDFTHESFRGNAEDYGDFMSQLFDVWIAHNNPKIMLRYCSSIVRLLLGKTPLTFDLFNSFNDYAVITISSDGDLYPDDTLRSTNPDFGRTGKTVFNTTLNDYLGESFFKELKTASGNLPKECYSCCWQNVCNGGQLVHRYSSKNGFNNPSVMCDGLKKFYRHVSFYLIENGIDQKTIERNLISKHVNT